MRIILLLWLVIASVSCGVLLFQHSKNKSAIAQVRERIDLETAARAAREATMKESLAQTHRELDDLHQKIRSAEVRLSLRRARSAPGLSSIQQRRLALEPDYAQFQKRKTRRSVWLTYGRFFDSVDLPPEKRARLSDLLQEKLFIDQDAKSLATTNGLTLQQTNASPTIARTKSEIEDQLFELLGPELFHQYRSTPLVEKFEPRIVSLDGRLEDERLPRLTDEQRKSLREAYRIAAYPWVPGKERNKTLRSGDGSPEPTSIRLDEKVEQLISTTLLPEQLDALKALHSDARAQEAINKRLALVVNREISPVP